MSNKEHPHADLLRAIADGEALQTYHPYTDQYEDAYNLSRLFSALSNKQALNWRIKPDPPS